MDSAVEFDESLHLSPLPGPEAQAMAGSDRERLTKALEQLSPRSREVIVLRELEGCSYKEIASITTMPIGTGMSPLARAREPHLQLLSNPGTKEAVHDL